MRKRILSLLICIVMCLQIVPATAYAKWVNSQGQARCAECGEWVDEDEICDDCGCHKDCDDCSDVTHCWKCGACSAFDAWCETCGLCGECIEDGDDDHCKFFFAGCHYHGDVCDQCGLCPECEEETGRLCVICGECTEGSVCWDVDECPSGEWHCEDCGIAEWGCPGCDVCTYTDDDVFTYDGFDWHKDCAVEEGILCWYCKEVETYCDSCGLCESCIEELMQHCLICGQCYIEVDPCETFDQDHCQDHCVTCVICNACYYGAEDELCPDCGFCPDCTRYCSECDACMSDECEGACEDGGDHCPNCCEICDECGRCMLALDYEACDYCGLCEFCCAENGCEDCGLCCMYDGFDTHKCDDCGECVPDEEPCEFCGLCVNCCADNGCDECGMCAEDPDYDDHFCPECGDCMGDEDPCEDCGLCEECCAENACEFCGMCVEDSDYEDHICEQCGNCTDEYNKCPDCGLCEQCCMDASECSDYLCAESSEYEEHFCEFCGECFHEVIQCETCEKVGSFVCVDCCSAFGHAGVPGGKQKNEGPVILQQPEDAHAIVSDVLCKNGVYKNHGLAPEENYVSFSVTVEKPYGVSFKWQQKWVDGWHDLEDDERFRGTDTDTLTAQVACDECVCPTTYRCVISNHSGFTVSDEVKTVAEHYYNVWYASEWRESTDVPAGYHVLMCCGDSGCEEWKPKTKAKHEYIWTVLEAPTADKKGKNQGVCSVCGYKTVVETPMNHDHQWMWNMENDCYVCTIKGCTETTIRYVCDKCNEVPLDQIAKIWLMDDRDPKQHYLACSACRRPLISQAHIFSEPEVIQEATENTRGITRQTCGCGYEKNEYTPKLPHTHDFISNPLDVGDYGGMYYNSDENNYKIHHTYNENCHWKICLKKVNGKVCGEIYAQEPHHFVLNTNVVDTTEPVQGGQEYALICLQCGYETTETVPDGETGYWLSFRNARAMVYTADGTVRDNAYWAKPGDIVEVLPTPTIGRTINSWTVSGDSDTLRSAGYKVNSLGIRELLDANGKRIVSERITFTMGDASVGLNGGTLSCSHNYGENLKISYNEKEHWRKCESCGLRAIERESHSFTTDENGVSTCDVCGYSYYDVWLGGKPFDSISLTRRSGSGWASYDPASKTLLLNNYAAASTGSAVFDADAADLSEQVYAMLYSPHDLAIVLTGSSRLNSVSLGNTATNGVGVFVDGNLIMRGTGALTVSAKSGGTAYGLYTTGDITNSAAVTFQIKEEDRKPAAKLYGVYAEGGVTNGDKGTLHVQTGHSDFANIALYSDSVLNNGELSAKSGCSEKDSFGIYAENSVVNNGELSADAYYGTIGKGYAVHAPLLEIKGNTHLMGDAAVLHEVTSLSVDPGMIIEGNEAIADDWELTAADQNTLPQLKTASIHGTKSYGVWIGGQQFADGRLTIRAGEGTAAYSPKTGILTLTDAVITEMCDVPMYGGSFGIYCDSDNEFSPALLTVELEGENVIRLNGEDAAESSVIGVRGSGVLLTGEGSLAIDIDAVGTDKVVSGLSCGNTVVNEAVVKMNLTGDHYLCGIECNLENRGNIQIDAVSKGSCYGFYADRLENTGAFEAAVRSTTAGEDAVALELTDEAQNSGRITVSAIGEGDSGIGINAAETVYNTGFVRASGTKQAITSRYPIYFAESSADESDTAGYVISGGGAFGQKEDSFASAMWMNENYVLSANNKVLAKEIRIRASKVSVSGRTGAIGSPVTYLVRGDVPEGTCLYAVRYAKSRPVEFKMITAVVTDEEIDTGLKVVDGSVYKIFLLNGYFSALCEAWQSNR